MGYNFWEEGKIGTLPEESILSYEIINLAPDLRDTFNALFGSDGWKHDNDDDENDDEGTSFSTNDPWMKAALQIQKNLLEMSSWVEKKKSSYIGFSMKDDEANLIESTVTSFIATTASEIESLSSFVSQEHQNNSDNHKEQYMQHCNGIVQILMNELKDNIMEPFRTYQKQRNRIAVKLWQRPLQCHFQQYEPQIQHQYSSRNEDDLSEVLGLNDDDDISNGDYGFGGSPGSHYQQRFIPSRPAHRFHQDFYTSYEQDRFLTLPPAPFSSKSSLFWKEAQKDYFQTYNATNIKSTTTTEPERRRLLSPFLSKTKHVTNDNRMSEQSKNQSLSYQIDPNNPMGTDHIEDYYYSDAAQLQQESMLIEATLNSDLESVTQMEKMMINITTLLSQFAELAQEQQEDVWEINKTTADTKENMDKGKDQLIDAKERTASSKHYMAKTIAVLGILLLILNWIVP